MSRRSRRRQQARAARSRWPRDVLTSLPRAQERVRLDRRDELLEERRFYADWLPGVAPVSDQVFRVRTYMPGSRRVSPFFGVRDDWPELLRMLPQLNRSERECLRRQQRREVLFAKEVAGGRGIGRDKRWRRSWLSNYSCR